MLSLSGLGRLLTEVYFSLAFTTPLQPFGSQLRLPPAVLITVPDSLLFTTAVTVVPAQTGIRVDLSLSDAGPPRSSRPDGWTRRRCARCSAPLGPNARLDRIRIIGRRNFAASIAYRLTDRLGATIVPVTEVVP